MANIQTARRSGLVLRGGKNVRSTAWVGLIPTDTALAAPSTAVLLAIFGASALAIRPFTIVRTRGFFYCRSDQVAAAERYGACLGMAVVSEQSTTIGVTAIPTPNTDRDSDLWFVFEELQGFLSFSDATGIREVGTSTSYDSKAMRKVALGQQLAIVIETQDTVSSGAVLHGGRMLIKLH